MTQGENDTSKGGFHSPNQPPGRRGFCRFSLAKTPRCANYRLRAFEKCLAWESALLHSDRNDVKHWICFADIAGLLLPWRDRSESVAQFAE
ncbi:MAG: hypothetical protein ABSC42_10865 [Tepidisphaeraceae bacterium]|jgi:hypothetical protein